MKNPLKKINSKAKSKGTEELTRFVGDLVAEKTALAKSRNALDVRCQSLEIALVDLQRKNKDLEKIAFENKQKAVELQQKLFEARLMANLYNDMHDKSVEDNLNLRVENIQLKRRLRPTTIGERTESKTEEVSSNG